jgi:nucleoporin SEH1
MDQRHHQPAGASSSDPIQQNLDAVTRRLVRPAFLQNLTPSRLPSQAASDSSLSPNRGEAPHSRSAARSARASFGSAGLLPPSHLNHIVSSQDAIDEEADLFAPLIQDPPAEEGAETVDQRALEHLETSFVGAHHAFSKMASERNFQPFSHGHQDIVTAVDFNYFGTRMVTASSDHRLKVWDKKDDSWILIESWKAHDAEVVDVSAILLYLIATSRLGMITLACA